MASLRSLAAIISIVLVAAADPSICSSLPVNTSTPGDLLWPNEPADPLSSGHELQLLPTSPSSAKANPILSPLGSEMWTYYTFLAARDSALYALNVNGLEVFDISNPSQPSLRFRVPIADVQAHSFLALSENYLCLANVSGLITYDISSQFAPLEVSRLPLPGILMEIEIHGDRCYVGVARTQSDVSTDTPGWYALSLANPAAPTILGSYFPSTRHKDCRRFEVSGNLVFAAALWDSAVEVFDISNPATPQFVANSKFSSYCEDVALSGNYLYVLKESTISVYDVTIPTALSLESAAFVNASSSMARAGSALFTTYYTGEIQVFDISVPGEITALGTYQSRANHFSLGSIDSLLLIPEIYFGFQLVDISEPSAPSLVSTYSPPALYMLGVAADSSHAYVVDFVSSAGGTGEVSRKGIHVVDIANPSDPKYVRTTSITEGNPRNPLLYDSLVIVHQCQPSRIYSVADPDTAVFLSQFPVTWTQTWESEIWNGMLVTASLGLLIGDISNPASPTVLLQQSFSDLETVSIVVDSGIAYMGGFYAEGTAPDCFLQIVDFNLINAPKMLAMISLEDTSFPLGSRLPEQITKHGSYVYAADKRAGLKVIDVSMPKSPILVNTIMPNQEAFYDVAARENLLFAATSQSLKVFDLLNPASPVLIQSIHLTAIPQRLDIVGDLLHVGCYYGYWIFKINPPTVNCGDADGSGLINISDVVYLISNIFSGGPGPIPVMSGDANADQFISISDAVYLINFIFSGGPAPCAE